MSRTSLQLDKDTSHVLGLLAKHEDRTKKGEIQFLVKNRMKSLGLSESKGKQTSRKIMTQEVAT